jgi:hypothetical protein
MPCVGNRNVLAADDQAAGRIKTFPSWHNTLFMRSVLAGD